MGKNEENNEVTKANSYCIDYLNDKFFIGLANKYKEETSDEESVDIKGYIFCSKDEFKSLFKSILLAIAKCDKESGSDFINELVNEEKIQERKCE